MRPESVPARESVSEWFPLLQASRRRTRAKSRFRYGSQARRAPARRPDQTRRPPAKLLRWSGPVCLFTRASRSLLKIPSKMTVAITPGRMPAKQSLAAPASPLALSTINRYGSPSGGVIVATKGLRSSGPERGVRQGEHPEQPAKAREVSPVLMSGCFGAGRARAPFPATVVPATVVGAVLAEVEHGAPTAGAFWRAITRRAQRATSSILFRRVNALSRGV